MLRRITYLLAVILLCSSCKGGSAQHAKANKVVDLRTVRIDPSLGERPISDTIRLGRLRSGEIIAKTIRIENHSDSPLVLTHHQVGCGCLSAQYDRKPIVAGGSTDVVMEFDSRTMYGLQLKTLNLFFAEKDQPLKIFVEAEVE